MQTEPAEALSMDDWLTTPCEYCGLRLAYCSCYEWDSEPPEEKLRRN